MSHLLICCFFFEVWQHIFMLLLSAIKDLSGPVGTKTGQAKLNNLINVMPHTIAYAATQVSIISIHVQGLTSVI
jgi:hypothetical protein